MGHVVFNCRGHLYIPSTSIAKYTLLPAALGIDTVPCLQLSDACEMEFHRGPPCAAW